MRPDVVALVVQHLPDRAGVAHRYAAGHASVPAAFAKVAPEAQVDAVRALTRAELERTSVAWELGDGRFDPVVARALRPGRALYHLAPSADAARAPLGPLRAPGSDLLRRLGPSEEIGLRSRRVLSDVSRHRGVWHLLRGEVEPGAACLEEAVALDETNPRALLNLAAARRRTGDLPAAIALLEQTLKLAPTYAKARENLRTYQAAASGSE